MLHNLVFSFLQAVNQNHNVATNGPATEPSVNEVSHYMWSSTTEHHWHTHARACMRTHAHTHGKEMFCYELLEHCKLKDIVNH